MYRIYSLLFVLLIVSEAAQAQFVVKGSVQDAAAKLGLPGVNVVASPVFDSTQITGTTTNAKGEFELKLNRITPQFCRICNRGGKGTGAARRRTSAVSALFITR
jgi:hypothetical protein